MTKDDILDELKNYQSTTLFKDLPKSLQAAIINFMSVNFREHGLWGLGIGTIVGLMKGGLGLGLAIFGTAISFLPAFAIVALAGAIIGLGVAQIRRWLKNNSYLSNMTVEEIIKIIENYNK